MKSVKKGQSTAFVIVGIIVLALVILMFFLRDRVNIPFIGPQSMQDRIATIREHVEECIMEVGDEPIRRIGLQGGHLSTPQGTYKLYNDIPVSYLCYDIPEKAACRNRMLLQRDMEGELADAIKDQLRTCLQVKKFARGVELRESDHSVKVSIGKDNVVVDVKKPIVLRKGDEEANVEMFSHTFSYPLGRLYEVSQDIVDVEASVGKFEQLSYMLAHKGQYLIEIRKPYPDVIYLLQVNGNDYLFQFFIEGEPAPAATT